MAENRLYQDEMLELIGRSIDFIRDFFAPNGISSGRPKKAMVSVSGGIDSITTTYLLAEALGPEGVVAFHLPNGYTVSTDTQNFNLAVQELGIEHYQFSIDQEVEELVRMLPHFEDMDPSKYEFCRARIPTSFFVRESLVYAYGKLQEGLYRAVGALDRAEYLTGNFPKNSCTLDVAPILGMYRQQIRGLAVLLGVPDNIIHQPAENDADPECVPVDRLFTGGEIAQDLFLYLIHERSLSDDEIHLLGGEYDVKFDQRELDLVRQLIKDSEHKRVLHIPYPHVTHLGIDERNLIVAYIDGNMIYD